MYVFEKINQVLEAETIYPIKGKFNISREMLCLTETGILTKVTKDLGI